MRVNTFLKQSCQKNSFDNIDSLFTTQGMLDAQTVDPDVIINLLAAMPIDDKNFKAVKNYLVKLVPVLPAVQRRKLNQAIETKLLAELFDKDIYQCMIDHSCITYRCMRRSIVTSARPRYLK
jgi:hypothetical protein